MDVFIGNYVWNNNTFPHGDLLQATGENRFIDPILWNRFLTFCEERLDRVIEQEAAEDK